MSQQPDAWLALVNWERECPFDWSGSFRDAEPDDVFHHPDTCQCNGAGRVAVLPGLRVPCETLRTIEGLRHTSSVMGLHPAKGCPGWQLAPESRDTLEDALVAAGFRVVTDRHPHRECTITVRGGSWKDTRAVNGEADTPLAALLAAVGKLMAEEASHARP